MDCRKLGRGSGESAGGYLEELLEGEQTAPQLWAFGVVQPLWKPRRDRK